jgi:hypothetical protein
VNSPIIDAFDLLPLVQINPSPRTTRKPGKSLKRSRSLRTPGPGKNSNDEATESILNSAGINFLASGSGKSSGAKAVPIKKGKFGDQNSGAVSGNDILSNFLTSGVFKGTAEEGVDGFGGDIVKEGEQQADMRMSGEWDANADFEQFEHAREADYGSKKF